jgi:hypothetical protein
VYVRNEGNVPFVLAKSSVNWSPLNAAGYISLAWDYVNATVVPSGVVKVVLSLSVSLNAQSIGAFSFDTVITAAETT